MRIGILPGDKQDETQWHLPLQTQHVQIQRGAQVGGNIRLRSHKEGWTHAQEGYQGSRTFQVSFQSMVADLTTTTIIFTIVIIASGSFLKLVVWLHFIQSAWFWYCISIDNSNSNKLLS